MIFLSASVQDKISITSEDSSNLGKNESELIMKKLSAQTQRSVSKSRYFIYGLLDNHHRKQQYRTDRFGHCHIRARLVEHIVHISASKRVEMRIRSY